MKPFDIKFLLKHGFTIGIDSNLNMYEGWDERVYELDGDDKPVFTKEELNEICDAMIGLWQKKKEQI